MKPFNLKEYLEHPDRKVVTGDGRNVRIICTDSKVRNYSIIALVEEPSGFENIFSYTEGGQMVSYEPSKKYDLFFAPEKHEGWVNIYRDLGLGGMRCKCIFDSEEEALRESDTKAIAAIKIEWEEEQ